MMLFKKILYFFFLILPISSSYAAEETAASLMAKAMELVQKGEKKKALPMLEKAFELSKDPEEIKDIGILIIEASPKTFPKRESFLRYLIQNYPEHEERGKWLKEMADRKFDAAQFDDAEELYLRAAEAPQADTTTIKYKLAWVAWNQKNRELALNRFLELYPTAEASLKEQLQKDITKLWLEIGELPAQAFDQMGNLPSGVAREMAVRLIQSLSPQTIPQEKDELMLAQLKKNASTNDVLKETIERGGLLFVKEPCFLFHKVIEPEDSYSPTLLLACAASKKRPPAENLLPYFNAYQGPRDEKIDWAQASCLVDLSRKNDAAEFVLQASPEDLSKRSKEFTKFTETLLLDLPEENFRAIYSIAGFEKFESLMKNVFNDSLLMRLEAVDADEWLPYEEKEIAAGKKKANRAFYEKRGVQLIQKNSATPEELSKILESIFKFPLEKNDRAMKDGLTKLKKRVDTRLPGTFSPAFKNDYDKWVKEIDDTIVKLNSSSNNLQMIARPVFQTYVRKNIDEMKTQIHALILDPELASLASVFEEKKEELRTNLESKYQGFLNP